MRYISICSGIEAATTAWHGLGWQPLAFSEIDAFPSAVLADRYPSVPNLGDMSKYREWPEELLADCELLVGGTPCQAFSVAGLRKSLDDERGNLSLIYVHLFHHINEIRRKHGRSPAIALWENVPGVLSTKDNAFGCFISGLLGVDDTIEVEGGKWPKAGFLGSETVRVGYRVLDAQYFAVAQRRRRVFLVAVPCELVASLGERACPSEILSLRESVLGNPPTRGEARQAVAGGAAERAASGGEPYRLDRAMFNQEVNAQYEPQITDDGVASSMVARGPAAVMWNASDQANAERLVDHAGTLNCNKGQRGGWIAPGVGTVAIRTAQTSANGLGITEEGTGPLSRSQVPACVTGARTHALTTRAAAVEEDGTGRGKPIIPAVFTKAKRAQSANDDESWVPGEVAPTQNQFDVGDTRATTVVAYDIHTSVGKKGASEVGIHTALRSRTPGQSENSTTTVVAFTQNSRDEVRQIDGNGQITGSLSAEAGMHQTNYIAFANRTRDGLKVPEAMKDGVVPALTNPGQGGRSDAVNVASHMQVRRLTPTECCRLQGFPDYHCDIVYRKKPAADGPKYRALGNSMAVPCMAWLGWRIHKATGGDK